MSHKVHPKSYRLRGLSSWDSRWFSKKKIAQYLEEDFKIREVVQDKIGKLGIEKVEIERFPGKLNVIIHSGRPGIIIGRAGSGIEELKKALEKKVFKGKKKNELKLEIKEIKNVWGSAALAGQWVAQQLEKRVRHRKVLKQGISKIMTTKGVEGARLEISGRLGGAEIARREWLQQGRLPRQTLRADIDYAEVRASCSYGTIGVKVWIYKGEKFE